MRILIASPIFRDSIEKLEQEHDVVCAFNKNTDELKELIKDREVLIFRSGVDINAEVMAKAPDLKLLIRGGSGIDNLDLDYTHKRGLELIRIPGPGARAVAEMSFALILGLARNILVADGLLRMGKWAKHELTGHLLAGKVLGIVGAGNIGSQVGQLGAAWGMEVLGCVDPSLNIELGLHENGIRMTMFDEVLAKADFLSIHVPLTKETRNLINEDALALMKQGSFLVNLARGGVVDEMALYKELINGRLSGAALDVHEQEGDGKISPLAELPNVILTPHIGASTIDSQRVIGETIIESISTFSKEINTAKVAVA